MPPFANQGSVSLSAGIVKAIYPPIFARSVTIGNTGSAAVLVYTTQGDDSTSISIAAGFERQIEILPTTQFDPNVVAFYLKCSVNNTIYLIWT